MAEYECTKVPRKSVGFAWPTRTNSINECSRCHNPYKPSTVRDDAGVCEPCFDILKAEVQARVLRILRGEA